MTKFLNHIHSVLYYVRNRVSNLDSQSAFPHAESPLIIGRVNESVFTGAKQRVTRHFHEEFHFPDVIVRQTRRYRPFSFLLTQSQHRRRIPSSSSSSSSSPSRLPSPNHGLASGVELKHAALADPFTRNIHCHVKPMSGPSWTEIPSFDRIQGSPNVSYFSSLIVGSSIIDGRQVLESAASVGREMSDSQMSAASGIERRRKDVVMKIDVGEIYRGYELLDALQSRPTIFTSDVRGRIGRERRHIQLSTDCQSVRKGSNLKTHF